VGDSLEHSNKRSIRKDKLTAKYLEFCTKNGFREGYEENEKDTLEYFGLSIKEKADNSTNAYLRIRWKTHFEKSKKKREKGDQGEEVDNKEEKASNITKFLKSECTLSVIKTDFILVEELTAKYNEY